MNRTSYRPGPLSTVEAKREDQRWTLVFVRELHHPREQVWDMLTDPDRLQSWAPFDADRNLGSAGAATLTMVGGAEAMKVPAQVHRAERPALLEYDWGGDLLRWELEPVASGTRITLRQTIGDAAWLSKMAAGWHLCLDVAELALDGTPIGRIAGNEARAFGWEELDRAYAEKLAN